MTFSYSYTHTHIHSHEYSQITSLMPIPHDEYIYFRRYIFSRLLCRITQILACWNPHRFSWTRTQRPADWLLCQPARSQAETCQSTGTPCHQHINFPTTLVQVSLSNMLVLIRKSYFTIHMFNLHEIMFPQWNSTVMRPVLFWYVIEQFYPCSS